MSGNPIELGLHRAAGGDTPLVALADRLLSLLSTLAPDYASLDAGAFRASVDRWRESLRAEHDPDRIMAIVARLADDCERFFRRVRLYEGELATEFGEVVGVFREVLGTLRGGAQSFDERFAQSTAHLARLRDVEDIRELRRALATEVDVLKKLAADRREQDTGAFQTLSTRVAQLESNLHEAREEASKDGLTDLANRRTFDRGLAGFVGRAEKSGFRFVLALIDVDDFKRVNDEHGHQVGDRVLLCVASLIARSARHDDLVARYGGEEFALIFAGAQMADVQPRIEAMLHDVTTPYTYEQDGEERSLRFTFSVGATEFAAGDTAEDLVRRADEALYRAKRNGKHRLEIAQRTLLRRLFG